MSKQAATFGQATDIWKFLAKGDFTVDAETKAKAQKDIAEDGYWGVEQTSDRIVSLLQHWQVTTARLWRKCVMHLSKAISRLRTVGRQAS